jgi:hypothetical protein
LILNDDFNIFFDLIKFISNLFFSISVYIFEFYFNISNNELDNSDSIRISYENTTIKPKICESTSEMKNKMKKENNNNIQNIEVE